MRRLRTLLLLGGLGTVAACLLSGIVAIFVIGGSAPNRDLNPLKGFVLRLTLWRSESQLARTAGNDATPLRFTIQKSQTASVIGDNLAAQGLIVDSGLFGAYVDYYGLAGKLQAGTYLLNRTQTIAQIAVALSSSGSATVRLRIGEGWRIEQIVDVINQTPDLPFSGTDFLAAVRGVGVPPAILQTFGIPAGGSLEGFLYPATYELALDATAAILRDKMLAAFNEAVPTSARSALGVQGLTLYQAVTLASIVERESVVADERSVIASVYLNRLRKPMTLDADPTIQYALGNTRTPATWWPQITQADYRNVNSPYNTYLVQGLPPSPISNARKESILAVIYPAQSPYFYFRASCVGDGRHRFAETFEKHLANACP